MTKRLSIRLRLTVLYGAAILATGAALLAVNYALVSRQLGPRIERASTAGTPTAPGLGDPAPTEVLVDPQARQLADHVRHAALRELVVQSGVALGLIAVVSVGAGWLVAGHALRPLHRITASARRLSERNLHERLAMTGPRDEIRELADTFDAMLARLDAAFASQRRFVANASHELRTPLTIARTATDRLAAKRSPAPEQVQTTIAKVQYAIDRSERLLAGLLLLARSQRGLTAREPTDLAELAARTIDHARPEATARQVRIQPSLRPAPLDGDPVLLERLIGNLVENAIRYNRPGGWVTVATQPGDGRPRLTVGNSGPVIPPNQVASLFEPFRRGQPDRTTANGTGLGLAIVRSIAAAHHGVVQAHPIQEGGLQVQVTFGIKRPQPPGPAVGADRRQQRPDRPLVDDPARPPRSARHRRP